MILTPMDYASLAPRLPQPADPDQARIGLEHWAERAARAGLPSTMDPATSDSGRQMLRSLFGNSSFLGQLALANPASFCRTVEIGPEQSLKQALAETAAAASAPDEATIMARLRQMRQRVALLVALADITGLWTVEQVTRALSDFAEASLEAATRFLLLAGESNGQIKLNGDPNAAGYVILGMGKLGARELNYSSDIDLIVLYDMEKAEACGLDAPGTFFVRLTRSLVRIMADRTADGYVFRTDLRLRPDPGSTPLAISITAAETYYESVGQNWERAAMIKARPVAGDRAAGDEFLKYLRPYVWRKSLDFAAIQDIHSIKRQINAHRGGGAIALHGHNIKLGRGGIREIEFFAQTQQLIYGGRSPELRGSQTVPMLAALAEAGMVEPKVAEEMTTAYRYLRKVEHRLQMIADEQTHSLPRDRCGHTPSGDLPGLSRYQGVHRRIAGSAAHGRTPLRASVRRRTDAVGTGQSRVHWRRGRSGDAEDDRGSGLQQSVRRGRRGAAMASRPLSRHHYRPLARIADGADPHAAERAGRDGAS